MTARGYLEVETPMMQPIAGGAIARRSSRTTTLLDMDLYLRIAPELYLKRLTVGGLEKVFEINRNFRNEGMSTAAQPRVHDDGVLEAYADYQALMRMTEEMIATAARKAVGSEQITFGDHQISLQAPFVRLSLREAAREAASASAASRGDRCRPAQPRGGGGDSPGNSASRSTPATARAGSRLGFSRRSARTG